MYSYRKPYHRWRSAYLIMALFGTPWTPIVNAAPHQTPHTENEFLHENCSESTLLCNDYTVDVSKPESTVIFPHLSCSNGFDPVTHYSCFQLEYSTSLPDLCASLPDASETFFDPKTGQITIQALDKHQELMEAAIKATSQTVRIVAHKTYGNL